MDLVLPIHPYVWISDSIFGKRVLKYLENRGNLDYHQLNVFLVAL